MKHTIIALFTVFILVSCSKDKVRCYECQVFNQGVATNQYQDMGCMTKDEWERFQLSDPNGNDITDKEKYCRQKK